MQSEGAGREGAWPRREGREGSPPYAPPPLPRGRASRARRSGWVGGGGAAEGSQRRGEGGRGHAPSPGQATPLRRRSRRGVVPRVLCHVTSRPRCGGGGDPRAAVRRSRGGRGLPLCSSPLLL